MAVISTLIGGIGGFFTFAGAMLVFKTSFLTALSLYCIVGLGITASIIVVTLVWRTVDGLSSQHAELIVQPANVSIPEIPPRR